MAALMGAILLIFISLGTASLAEYPLIPIAIGAVLGGLTLLLTRGRLVLLRRRGGNRSTPAATTAVPVATPAAGGWTEPSTVDAPADAGAANAGVGVVGKDDLTVVPLDGRTSGALACGVAGLFMFNLIFGTIAVVLGLLALRRGTPGRWGRPAAVTAVILGVIDLIVLAAIMIPELTDGRLQIG